MKILGGKEVRRVWSDLSGEFGWFGWLGWLGNWKWEMRDGVVGVSGVNENLRRERWDGMILMKEMIRRFMICGVI